MAREKMDTRELGLILGQQILNVDDLHYGYWNDELELSFANLPEAQRRYTEKLLEAFPPASDTRRVLDVGCGTGNTMAALIQRGYRVDGMIPSASLARIVRERLSALSSPGGAENDAQVFECKLEEFDTTAHSRKYDVILFSESFQYMAMEESFPVLERILLPGGRIIICDFFRTVHDQDGAAGDHAISGGHPLKEFHEQVERRGYRIEMDRDITKHMSPNFKLVNDLLMLKTKPVLETCSLYLGSRYPRSWRFLKWVFRKRWKKLDYKYLSGLRSPETFEKYKSYRMIVLRDEHDV